MCTKTKLILLTVISLFLLSGCGDTFCPGLPEEYADYFPYKKGQIIKFSNNKNDTIVWNITEFSQSTDQYIPTCGKCQCGGEMSQFESEILYNSIYLSTLNGLMKVESKNSLLFTFIFNYGYGTKSDFFRLAIHPNTTNEISIKNEQEVSRISLHKFRKGKGVISFDDTDLNCTWKLVENN